MVKGLDGKSGYQVQFHILSIKEDKEEEEEPNRHTHVTYYKLGPKPNSDDKGVRGK